MSILRIKNLDLLLDEPKSYISSDTASGVSTLNVKNLTGFTVNQLLVIGFVGFQGSEIVKTHGTTAPSAGVITLASTTIFPHSSGTTINAIEYDQLEISIASTKTGTKSVLTTVSISINSDTTNYNDTANSSGYYFGRFKNSITGAFSNYSDPIPLTGYTQISARSIIDSALGAINKKTSLILSDEFAFTEIDNCQIEVLREMKRWSWMQKFDQNIGQLSTGQWKVALPADCDDQNTNKSIYNFKIGKGTNITWVDKEKWNDLIENVSHTTLANSISVGNVSITLTDSSNFDDSGTITIGANTYSYTANNRSTNVLTISASTTTNTSGDDVFQGATTGNPQYWTTFGGYVYFYPVLNSTYNQRDAYMDYYSSLIKTTTDTQTIIVPDPMVVNYYLQWKFMLKQANGEDTLGSDSKYKNYIARRDTMKRKESLNRTFQLKPLQNRFRMNSDDPVSQRLGNFSLPS